MKASYGQQLKPGQVIRIWPDSGPIDKSRIGDNEQVIQVTFVLPYADDARNFIDRNCDLKRFVFSTPFIAGDPAGMTELGFDARLCTHYWQLLIQMTSRNSRRETSY